MSGPQLRTGLTLVELVIVVSIIGMLASIAIPNYLRYPLRTRAAASMTHLSAIATVESAYYTEFGTYLSVSAPVPGTLPGTERVPWPSGSGFDLLSFAPEGSVRFQYAVGAGGAATVLRARVPCDAVSGRSRF